MSMEPFEQLAGNPLDVYVAPYGEAFPDVDDPPAGNWTLLGTTDGGQKIKDASPLTYFYDDSHQGPVKATRPKEDKTYSFLLVDLLPETYGTVLSNAAAVSTDITPNVKILPLKRGRTPTVYALLLRGETSSPEANLPAQFEVTKGVFDGEHELEFSKTARVGLQVEFHALEDDAVTNEDERMGRLVVQTS